MKLSVRRLQVYMTCWHMQTHCICSHCNGIMSCFFSPGVDAVALMNLGPSSKASWAFQFLLLSRTLGAFLLCLDRAQTVSATHRSRRAL